MGDGGGLPVGGGGLLVDGMNVIGARPDGWWRERDAAVRRLASALARVPATDDVAVVLVLDGRPLADLPEGTHHGVVVRYARRSGADAADDRIVELLAEDPSAEVVTSDRALRDRVRALGATVSGPGALWRRLDALADPDPGTSSRVRR